MSSFELTPEIRGELVDVAEALHNSFGQMTRYGVLIDSEENQITYVDALTNTELRRLSAAAYTAEFVKIARSSLDDIDYEELQATCGYVSTILEMNYLTSMSFGEIRAWASAPPKEKIYSSSLPLGSGFDRFGMGHRWGD